MRPAILVLLTLLLGLSLTPYPQAPASASCAGPMLDGEPIVLDHVVVLTIEGDYFVDGCQDSMGCSVGCDGGCEYDDPEPQPLKGVELQLRQHGRTWPLDTQDADEDGHVAWTFELPPDVVRGPARLVYNGDESRVRVR